MIPPVQFDMHRQGSDQSLHLDLDGLDLGGSSKGAQASSSQLRKNQQTISHVLDDAVYRSIAGPSTIKASRPLSDQRLAAHTASGHFVAQPKIQDDLVACNGHVDSFMAHIMDDCEDAHEILGSNTMLSAGSISPVRERPRNALALDIHGQEGWTQSHRGCASTRAGTIQPRHGHNDLSSQVLGGFASLGTSPQKTRREKRAGYCPHFIHLPEHGPPSNTAASGFAALSSGLPSPSSPSASSSRWKSLAPVAEDPMRTLQNVPSSLLPKFNIDLKKTHEWDGALLESTQRTPMAEVAQTTATSPLTWTVARFTQGERQWVLAPAAPDSQAKRLSRIIRVRCRGADFKLTAPPRAFEGSAYFDIHSLDGERVGANNIILTAAIHHKSFYGSSHSASRSRSHSVWSEAGSSVSTSTQSHNSSAIAGAVDVPSGARPRSESVGYSSSYSDTRSSGRNHLRQTRSRPNLRHARTGLPQGLARSSMDNLRRRSRLCEDSSPRMQASALPKDKVSAASSPQDATSSDSSKAIEATFSALPGPALDVPAGSIPPPAKDLKGSPAAVREAVVNEGTSAKRQAIRRRDASRLGGWLKKRLAAASQNASVTTPPKTSTQQTGNAGQLTTSVAGTAYTGKVGSSGLDVQDPSCYQRSVSMNQVPTLASIAQPTKKHELQQRKEAPVLNLHARKASISEDDLLAHLGSKEVSQKLEPNTARVKSGRSPNTFANGLLRLSPTAAFFKSLSPPSSPSQVPTDSESEDACAPAVTRQLPEALRHQTPPPGLTLATARLRDLSDVTLCMFIPLPFQAFKDKTIIPRRYLRIAFVPFAAPVPRSATPSSLPTAKPSALDTIRSQAADDPWQSASGFDFHTTGPIMEMDDSVMEPTFTSNRRSSFVQAFRVTALVIDTDPGSAVSEGQESLPEPTPFPIVLAICFSGHSIDFVHEGWERLGLDGGPIEAANTLAGEKQVKEAMLGVADTIVAACAAVMDI